MQIPVLRLLMRLIFVVRIGLILLSWLARRSPSRRRLYWITALGIAANALSQLDREPSAERARQRLQRPPRANGPAADDLTIIEGIGPKIAESLREAGIDTLGKLAVASEDELRRALAAAGMRFAPSLTTWAQQAQYASRGEWDALKTYQGMLSGGQES